MPSDTDFFFLLPPAYCIPFWPNSYHLSVFVNFIRAGEFGSGMFPLSAWCADVLHVSIHTYI